MTRRPAGDLAVTPLGDGHDRNGFTCGVESLDRYLYSQAGQDVRRKANAVFVLCRRGEPSHILAYYTLCATALSQGEIPEAARKHLPRHPLVSATLTCLDSAVSPSPSQGRAKALARSCWPMPLRARSKAPSRWDRQ